MRELWGIHRGYGLGSRDLTPMMENQRMNINLKMKLELRVQRALWGSCDVVEQFPVLWS